MRYSAMGPADAAAIRKEAPDGEIFDMARKVWLMIKPWCRLDASLPHPTVDARAATSVPSWKVAQVLVFDPFGSGAEHVQRILDRSIKR